MDKNEWTLQLAKVMNGPNTEHPGSYPLSLLRDIRWDSLDQKEQKELQDHARTVVNHLESLGLLNPAVMLIAEERLRQQKEEGWTLDHDDAHKNGEMAVAAACYSMTSVNESELNLDFSLTEMIRELWPWDWKWWKPKDPERNLVKAGALTCAEIERLSRK